MRIQAVHSHQFIMLGAMLGFVLIAGILVVRMLMDTTIKSEEDVERYLGVPLLSSIPYVKNFGKEERK